MYEFCNSLGDCRWEKTAYCREYPVYTVLKTYFDCRNNNVVDFQDCAGFSLVHDDELNNHTTWAEIVDLWVHFEMPLCFMKWV